MSDMCRETLAKSPVAPNGHFMPNGYEDRKTQAELKGLVDAQCDGVGRQNMEAVLERIHPDCIAYGSTRVQLTQQFDKYRLKVEPIAFQYIGHDDDYAYARATQQTTKLAGPEFQDNIIEQLYVFKRDDGTWKIWATAPLSVRLLKD